MKKLVVLAVLLAGSLILGGCYDAFEVAEDVAYSNVEKMAEDLGVSNPLEDSEDSEDGNKITGQVIVEIEETKTPFQEEEEIWGNITIISPKNGEIVHGPDFTLVLEVSTNAEYGEYAFGITADDYIYELFEPIHNHRPLPDCIPGTTDNCTVEGNKIYYFFQDDREVIGFKKGLRLRVSLVAHNPNCEVWHNQEYLVSGCTIYLGEDVVTTGTEDVK
ncbi:hypothetical protein KKH23_00660 [Patescibacteria group bacterium]|nr:hypothetical protein [Patescibacteria group bacterium]MBU0777259.1 hypothetical protein [Patescibacteria group bacterium]MBU0845705.1 hypothetical protein [Patescibacteria group bacterium]MBU0923063.1 hypothetical protein [Patescibacteria group bacterium]MBU1066615.1 hypothetical protein [Patescibacteria group bacterium]